MTDRNVTSSVVRSTPNGLNDLYTKINQATSDTELQRNSGIGSTIARLDQDIQMLRASVHDVLMTGDAMFGKAGHIDVAKQVKERNADLLKQKENLRKEILKKEAIVQKTNRDFSDVRDTLPEKQNPSMLHFIEDYTLAILSMAYLFLLIAINYWYVTPIETQDKLPNKDASFLWWNLFQGIGTSIFTTMIGLMLLYYMT
jgi:hypothetical protein